MTILAQYAGGAKSGRGRESGPGSRIWAGDLGTRSGPVIWAGKLTGKLGREARHASPGYGFEVGAHSLTLLLDGGG